MTAENVAECCPCSGLDPWLEEWKTDPWLEDWKTVGLCVAHCLALCLAACSAVSIRLYAWLSLTALWAVTHAAIVRDGCPGAIRD